MRIEDAVGNFYVLQEIDYNIKRKDLPFLRGRRIERFCEFRADYEDRLAKVLFDYLLTICLGEARHGRYRDTHYYAELPNGSSSSARNAVYRDAYKYDPKDLLEKLDALYSPKKVKWKNGYGGEKWWYIVKACKRYGKYNNTIFIDSVVSLSHNGTICFNKPFSISMNNVVGYILMLDVRNKRGILHTGAIRFNFDTGVLLKLEQAENLGIMRKGTRNSYANRHRKFYLIKFPEPVKWASERKLKELVEFDNWDESSGENGYESYPHENEECYCGSCDTCIEAENAVAKLQQPQMELNLQEKRR